MTHPIARGALLATAAALTTIAVGTHAGAQTSSCRLTAQPWDGKSYALAVVADGQVRHLQTAQDGRQVPPQTWTVDGLTQIWWAARNPALQNSAADFFDVYDVTADCEIVGGYRGIAGKQPSLVLQLGAVATTTTAAPTTTTTAQVTTTTSAPTTTTTATPPPATTTTGPQPLTTLRTTPIPTACAPDACQPALTAPRAPRLPETGRRTWPQVRLSLGLLAAGVAVLQLARVMQQDEELEG